MRNVSLSLVCKATIGGLAALTIAGCTGTRNPEDANIFDNISNLSTGVYQEEVAVREAQAQAIINANNATQGRIDNLDNQRQANASVLASLRGEVATVNAEIAAARAKLAGNAAASQELNALEAQVRSVNADVEAGGDASVARAELGRIRSAVRLLSS